MSVPPGVAWGALPSTPPTGRRKGGERWFGGDGGVTTDGAAIAGGGAGLTLLAEGERAGWLF